MIKCYMGRVVERSNDKLCYMGRVRSDYKMLCGQREVRV